jgi:hypothetical protein
MGVLPICVSGFPTSFFYTLDNRRRSINTNDGLGYVSDNLAITLGRVRRNPLRDRGKRVCILTTSVKKRKVRSVLALKDANFHA